MINVQGTEQKCILMMMMRDDDENEKCARVK
jgi:hypothetical protein